MYLPHEGKHVAVAKEVRNYFVFDSLQVEQDKVLAILRPLNVRRIGLRIGRRVPSSFPVAW